MDKNIGMINTKFGWSWLFVAILQAMFLGLYAFEPDWLGGYVSLQRRFLRLSHISFVALSLVNIFYGLSLDAANLSSRLKKTGSYLMIIAAVFMPAICLLSMANRFFQNLFFIPAISFACAIFIMAIGQLKRRQ